MRVGMLARAEAAELDMVRRLGFGCFEWVRFEESGCGSKNSDWRGAAGQVRDMAGTRGLRISAIAAWYRNALDPRQSEEARRVMERAIDVASYLGVKTVAAFPGAVIETTFNDRGGNLIYSPIENSIPAAVA